MLPGRPAKEARRQELTPNSNGQVKIWNYETQTDLKTFEVTDVPVRCVRYIARKNWVCRSRSMMVHTRDGEVLADMREIESRVQAMGRITGAVQMARNLAGL
jgi:hypothetical protein